MSPAVYPAVTVNTMVTQIDNYLPTASTSPSRDSSLTGRPTGPNNFHRSFTPIILPTLFPFSDPFPTINNPYVKGRLRDKQGKL